MVENGTKSHSEKISDELYSVLREEITLRIGQQNRCVDQSILITTGLIAAIAAILASEAAKNLAGLSFAGPLIALALFLYALVHELLCMNYVYQTWLILGISRYVRASQVQHRDRSPGSWERNGGNMIFDKLGRIGRLVVSFQPSLIYASILIGIVQFVSCLCLVSMNCGLLMLGWLLAAGLFGLFAIIAITHVRVVRSSSLGSAV